MPALDLGDQLGNGWFAKTVRPVRKWEEGVTCPAPGCDWNAFAPGFRVQRVVTRRGTVEMHEGCAIRMYREAAGVVLEPLWVSCWVHCDMPYRGRLTFGAATRAEVFEVLEENPWFELRGILRVVRPNPQHTDFDAPIIPGTWASPDLFCEHVDVPMCRMPASNGTLCIREAEHEVESTDGQQIPLCVACYMRFQDLLYRSR
jgi:hypothetical protein